MTNEEILTVKDLTVSLKYERREVVIVDRLSFSLYKGKTLAIVGESGCGKTLTALSLLRLIPQPPALPAKGRAIYQGQDLISMEEGQMRKIRGGRIAMIFQDPSSALNPVYPIRTQLLEVAYLHLQMEEKEAEARILAALVEVGIPHPQTCLNAYPHQLSGGMRQRVMIAMALLCEPDILIADEPTTALDVTIQAQVLELIRRLQRKKEMAVLLITHDMGVVAESADDVIVMYAGQSVEVAPVETIFEHMAHPYTQGLFRSRPAFQTVENVHSRLKAIPGHVPMAGHYPHGCRFHNRCPYVMDKCRLGEIPLYQVGKPHETRCVLWDQTPESLKKMQDFQR